MLDKLTILEQYFGYRSFREGQEPIMDALLENRDAVGIMPTGAGKSLCFQVPALLLPGLTLVISPLISLMKDQVNALTQNGIPAAFLNSSLSTHQYQIALENARQGKYKIIYAAPERLFTESFSAFAAQVELSMVTIDEAHCVSQWGQDFRPGYLQIPDFIRALPYRPVVSAFTATATPRVREDIVRLLELRDPFVLLTGFDRKNLSFEVRKPKHKIDAVLELLQQFSGGSGIIYCSTRKNVEEVCQTLQEAGYASTRYHAGLTEGERRENQEDFLYDRKTVMVATNAFGMGIDKSNVSFVIHYNMPKDLESYYQEAGRAGRDGQPANCILLYSGQDVITNQFLSSRADEKDTLDGETRALVQQQNAERLKAMTFYCHTRECLRAYILRYFGEEAPGFCGNCCNCNHHFEELDITIPAQKILSCVKRTGERYGAALITSILRGRDTERIRQLGLDKQTTYGLLSDMSTARVRDIINNLSLENYLYLSAGEYPVLSLGPRASEVLYQRIPVSMKLPKEAPPPAQLSQTKERTRTPSADPGTHDPQLFDRLRKLRGELAEEQHVPSYIVFSNSALEDMCARLPTTKEAFLEVTGVGRTKLERYGDAFLAEIDAYLKEQNL